MNLTKMAYANRPLTYTLLVCLMLMGLATYLNMPRNSMPPFLVRFVSIVTRFPGAGPERIEQLITDPLEEVIQEVPEVDFITSESRTGISIISVAIKETETDLQPIFDDIRRKVESIQDTLPNGSVTPKVNDEIGDVFGILLGITAPDFSYAELKDIADEVRDEIIKLPNAAKVTIVGTQEERVFIDFNHARLAELGLTQSQIENTLSATNIIYPGGEVLLGEQRVILEPSGNFENLNELRRTLITPAQASQPLVLGDVTDIYRDYIDPPRSLVSINGVPGLVLGVSLKEGGNIIDLGRDVDRKLADISVNYPYGVDLMRVASQDLVVDISVKDFLNNLLQSVAVVLAVMLVFLGLRTGLVVASLIPMAIFMGILFMAQAGVGLDKVSLAALIIALGMLVDNAIVVSESIMVKMEQGLKPLEAAGQTTSELILPLLIATLTTAAAFLPFFLAESTMGEIVGPIFVVVSLVLLSSWLLSLTIIPLWCMNLIRVKTHDATEQQPTRWLLLYRRILRHALLHPYRICLTLGILFFCSIWGLGFIPAIFMPDDDRNLVYADIEMPLGTAIERTEQVTNEINQFIQTSLLASDNQTGVTDWSSYVGEGAPKYDLGYSPSEGAAHQAHFIMNTSSDQENQRVIDSLEAFCFANYPEMTTTVSRLASGGGSADPIAIRVSGNDPEVLFQIAEDIKSELRALPGTKNIADDWGLRTKKLMVSINPTKAQQAGVSNYDIALSLRSVLSGLEIGQFREGDKVIPIVMRNSQTDRLDIEAIETLNIFSQNTNRRVPLTQVADISVAWQASKILRRDLYKTITVTSDMVTGVTAAEIIGQIKPWLEGESASWGSGYRFELGGESEDSSDAMNAVAENLPTAFFAILLLLIGQFNSIRKPFIVLLTIPLGFIGVVFGLLIARSYFGFFAFLGVISLAGIVINNAIVLLDRIKIEIEEFGRRPDLAIIAAAEQRFRPILLTTATTSLGLLPLWFGGGPMFEPMAIAIIFGLLFATVITLVFVPVLYKLLFRVVIHPEPALQEPDPDDADIAVTV